MVVIYKFTSPTNRVYIGQTVDLYSRYITHKNINDDSCPALYNSFRCHGFENHEFEIIEECKIEQLNERERYWQEYYNSVNYGLNCKYTKTHDKSGNLSEETKRKISNSQKGFLNHRYGKKYESPEKTPFYGKKHSTETRLKISINNKGLKRDDVSKRRISESKKGFKNPMYGKISPVAKTIFNTETGIYYDSIKDASFSIKMNYRTFKWNINKGFYKQFLKINK